MNQKINIRDFLSHRYPEFNNLPNDLTVLVNLTFNRYESINHDITLSDDCRQLIESANQADKKADLYIGSSSNQRDLIAINNAIHAWKKVSKYPLIPGTLEPQYKLKLAGAFIRGGTETDLWQAYCALRSLKESIEKGYPDLPEFQKLYRLTSWEFIQNKECYSEVEKSLETWLDLIRDIPERDTDWVDHFRFLGKLFIERFSLLGEPDDLEKSINYFHQAISSNPSIESANWIPPRAFILENLGDALRERYKLYENPSNLDSAIAYYKEALSFFPEREIHFFPHNHYLELLLVRYVDKGDPRDLIDIECEQVEYYKKMG